MKWLIALIPCVCFAAGYNNTTSIISETNIALWRASGKETSFCGWVYAKGVGETNNGTVITGDESRAGTTSLSLQHTANAGEYTIVKGGATSASNWVFSSPGDNQWVGICFTYDYTADANDPVVRVNRAAATLTTDTNPVGGTSDPVGGWAIGNVSAGSRTWNGSIRYVQVWQGILTAAEMDFALMNPCFLKTASAATMRLCLDPKYHPYTFDILGTVLVGAGGFIAPTVTDILPDDVGQPPIRNFGRITRKIP